MGLAMPRRHLRAPAVSLRWNGNRHLHIWGHGRHAARSHFTYMEVTVGDTVLWADTGFYFTALQGQIQAPRPPFRLEAHMVSVN